MKKGQQRRDEIAARRLQRAHARLRLDQSPPQASQPSGAVAADPSKLAHNNTYGALPSFYVDRAFTCGDCGAQEVWTATQQKWWYEIAKGHIDGRAVRCRRCRALRRTGRDPGPTSVRSRRFLDGAGMKAFAADMDEPKRTKEGPTAMIQLDGSVGEGGGQILRTALALSMCTGKPSRIDRIRAKRTKPGLMRQHLACVKAAVAITDAAVHGAELGSQSLVFEPGAVRAGEHRFAVGTAGSCSLVLQTVLPPLMLAHGASRLVLSGGTHNPMAPPFHFLERCFAPLLHKLGPGLELELRRLGFYPAGGGEFMATITPPAALAAPFDIVERGAPVEAFAEALAPGLPHRVAERELAAVGQALGWPRDQLRTPPVRANEGPGNALLLTAVHEHVSEVVTAFGEKGTTSETVARTALAEFEAYRAATGALGPHLADQWMLPLALALRSRRIVRVRPTPAPR